MITECLLKAKISFGEAESYAPSLIQIFESGGISVTELSLKAANAYIKERNLALENPDKYNIHYGKIYTDGIFWQYMQEHPSVKKSLLITISKLEIS